MNGKLLSIVLAIAMLAPAAGCIDLKSTFNRMPIADFTPQGYFESGSPLTFDGTKSTDYDGNITKWSWDFGDGTNSSVSKPTHVYGDVGNYTVELTVTDNLGKTNSISRNVHIAGKMRIKEGDYVEINYVGKYERNGTVFDTSIYSVALEANRTIGLRMRGNESAYSPLKVFVGSKSKDYNYTTVIVGLKEGLIGMAIGDTKNITIPPEKGYGIWETDEYSNISRASEMNVSTTYLNGSSAYSQIYQTVYKDGKFVNDEEMYNVTDAADSSRVVLRAVVSEMTNDSATIKMVFENGAQFTDGYGFNQAFTYVNATKYRVFTTAAVGHVFAYQSYYGTILYKVLDQNETTIILGSSSASPYYKYMIGETLIFEASVVSIVRK